MKKIKILANGMTIDAHVCEHSKIATIKVFGRPYKLQEHEYKIIEE